MKLLLASSLALFLAAPAVAHAHPMHFGMLTLRESAAGVWDARFRVSGTESRPVPAEPVVPGHCTEDEGGERERITAGEERRWTLRCGERGLEGAIVGMQSRGGASEISVLLRVEHFDGRVQTEMLDDEHPTAAVAADDIAADDVGQSLGSYTQLGTEHVLLGLDHLLFVLGLLLLVGRRWRLLSTITAFTIGHSITLALATLDIVRLPAGPVEACIALSVLLLAVELSRPKDVRVRSLAYRRPEAVAGAFGLLHGLGFATALRELGVPSGDFALALFGFNVGVELGQLLFVAVAALVVLALTRVQTPEWGPRVAPYAMGIAAAYWCCERVAAFVA